MSGGGAQKRIVKELGEIAANPSQGLKVQLADQSNLHVWDIEVKGPEQSVYAGGTFKLLLTLPKDYPFKPPVLNFQTKIYHPNVSNDERGSMCLGMLRPDEWKPPNRIAAVLDLTRSLLIEPNADDAVEAAVAEQYRTAPAEFAKTAREWVKRYAGGK